MGGDDWCFGRGMGWWDRWGGELMWAGEWDVSILRLRVFGA